MKPINEMKSASHRSSLYESTRSTPARTLARRVPRVFLALCVALCASSAATQAQTWETVDDIDSPSANASGITADRTGNVFVAGSIKDALGITHAIVMKSNDQGTNWVTSNDFTSSDGSAASFTAIASANTTTGPGTGEDHVVAIGKAEGSRWLIRGTTDAGTTWTTLDLFTHPNPNYVLSSPSAVALAGNGNIYVIGTATETIVTYKGKTASTTTVDHRLIRKFEAVGGLWKTIDRSFSVSAIACAGQDVFVAGGDDDYWRVRKSSDGGSTWTLVDNFRYDASGFSYPYGIAADSFGNLFVVGMGMRVISSGRGNSYTSVSEIHWLVRKGAAAGTGWTTVDDFGFPNENPNAWNMACGVTVDRNNDVHVTGFRASGVRHWVTRQRSAVTGLWSTTDDFNLALNGWAQGNDIAADPFGNLFAAGAGADSAGVVHNWLVRRKLAP